jgi:hypothetical protein
VTTAFRAPKPADGQAPAKNVQVRSPAPRACCVPLFQQPGLWMSRWNKFSLPARRGGAPRVQWQKHLSCSWVPRPNWQGCSRRWA